MSAIKIECDELGDVREQLTAWGGWLNMPDRYRLGYGSKSSFVIAPSGVDVNYDVEVAKNIELIMCGMRKKIHRPIEFVNMQSANKHYKCSCVYCVLKQYYLYDDNNVVSAQRLGMSVASYKVKRLSGEHYVFAKLS